MTLSQDRTWEVSRSNYNYPLFFLFLFSIFCKKGVLLGDHNIKLEDNRIRTKPAITCNAQGKACCYPIFGLNIVFDLQKLLPKTAKGRKGRFDF